ncbi:hypothetical protein SAMN04487820_1095 [Actinopolyspora mzabensis]|uniref:Glyoxalase/fosfomycin resistance/dioxygenase domain-containing protein n=1 Tax=Actinopolyspora mzabensis TaxID=995066 RepID=A0A1G9CNL6_ACTMZ|nr:VOC family protein [Actinopolyspora mzabensis]SDK53035.1 hypothetical protein SAMN04487820_1095 [Actinopolyspora mzabensis]
MLDQLWRELTDSRTLQQPRTFVRVFVDIADLEATTSWYERVLGLRRDMVMPYPEKNLTLTAVGGFLLIGGSAEALQPFRATVGTLLVPDIEPYLTRLRAEGAELVQQPFRAPVGNGVTVRHPDGSIIEYVHHRPA